jgi:hypothetical protein
MYHIVSVTILIKLPCIITIGRFLSHGTFGEILQRIVQRQLAVHRGRSQFGDVVLVLAIGRLDYVVGWVIRQRAVQPDGGQERH